MWWHWSEGQDFWVRVWSRQQWENLVVEIFEKRRERLALLCNITEGEGIGVAEGHCEFWEAGKNELVVASPLTTNGEEREAS